MHHKEEIEIQLRALNANLKEKQKERDFELSKIILEKSLSVMQEGYKKTIELNILLNADAPINVDSKEHIRKFQEFIQRIEPIKNWYNENCFYLPKIIRDDFLILINLSYDHIDRKFFDTKTTPPLNIWEKLIAVLKGIQENYQAFLDKYSILEKIDKD